MVFKTLIGKKSLCNFPTALYNKVSDRIMGESIYAKNQ